MSPAMNKTCQRERRRRKSHSNGLPVSERSAKACLVQLKADFDELLESYKTLLSENERLRLACASVGGRRI